MVAQDAKASQGLVVRGFTAGRSTLHEPRIPG